MEKTTPTDAVVAGTDNIGQGLHPEHHDHQSRLGSNHAKTSSKT
jgi:hypothetical protein